MGIRRPCGAYSSGATMILGWAPRRGYGGTRVVVGPVFTTFSGVNTTLVH